ncbi:MAG: bifunctional diaminohydroxyphosphoribosylaminopyrimidine deaminase/5-amino-6-(5-phosphoribosylamino)uracil reductase RibD [Aquabacterium sp.]|uniref:bifunctional diaminohydroxyphosphoribosylaminopyrimidine deaminase/5-amino-6-(5-phosphoribosylamino)uracil reductase RibD n=1 Tax=Aquabacterium sp. TaxID=1872578 RepID=UPI0027204049|nr:bifunctional diaminohydroxyphosphoribosylaminopyrimidine deaminase/5-amino-6-(5-phosphoribosylamino)uracil reductase RibD [Aquabacterium sp.]MDO9003303.1 bifunctional diaminohydroxyphosphoribosylaminopyrimidine deaminase/5-amino-6-(5-phosphoribosylamino)uracil reductase RibD [Aquabacterium sp.]
MSDQLFISQALTLARQAIGLSDPNPRVGCVLVSAQGEVMARGHTQQAGGPHAEVMALRDGQARGWSPKGGTAYVTLEPCSHHGRTPPCADAFVAAGLARVVVALLDPNPQVAGEGVRRLQEAGIKVDVLPADDPQAQEARELNLGFLSRMVRNRPWVRLKVAGSLDGRTALDNGQSQWITGPAARADGHAWRARSAAVLTGIGTVLDDDPRLDVREVSTVSQPSRVVLDSRWRTPPSARLLAAPGKVLIYGLASSGESAAQARQQALRDAGAELVTAPESPHSQVNLPFVLQDLARRGVNELHVEAGARLNAAFIEQDLVDELLLYLAPKLIGPGRGLAALPPLAQLSDAWALSFRDATMVGDDLRVIARPPGREHF